MALERRAGFRPGLGHAVANVAARHRANIIHAQMRMREVVEVLLAWEPGKRAEVSVTTRLHRDAPTPRSR